MAIIKAVTGKNRASLARIINYIMKTEKTEHKLIEGINCEGSTNCIQQMNMTKTMYKKEGGRQYKHYVLSFHPDDFKDEQGNRYPDAAQRAHEIVMEFIHDPLLQKHLEGYEVAIATHEDRDHLHAHIVINSVNMETGYKYRQSQRDLKEMKQVVKRLVEEHELHRAVKRKRREKGDIVINNIKGYQAVKRDIESKIDKKKPQYKSWVLDIFKVIQMALQSKPQSVNEFIGFLNQKGIQAKWQDKRKYITFYEMENPKHSIRDKKLSETFDCKIDKEAIINECESNLRARTRYIERNADYIVESVARSARSDATTAIRNREEIQAQIAEAERIAAAEREEIERYRERIEEYEIEM